MSWSTGFKDKAEAIKEAAEYRAKVAKDDHVRVVESPDGSSQFRYFVEAESFGSALTTGESVVWRKPGRKGAR